MSLATNHSTSRPRRLRHGRWSRLAAGAATATLLPFVVQGVASASPSGMSPALPSPTAAQRVTPTPVTLTERAGRNFRLERTSRIFVGAGSSDEVATVGYYLADLVRPSTGYAVPVERRTGSGASHAIYLVQVSGDAQLGPEGYRLESNADHVIVRARTAQGLFHGVQTLRQLMPPTIESRTLQPGRVTVPDVTITDYPRLALRGAGLDVVRHFQTVAAVKKYIDDIALYKVNTLTLHLSDDQGWRLFINSWPRLATYGGSTEVGGTTGGYYTQQDYAEIVRYAASRYVTVVPEIDTPGHTNAAQASYARLNCNGQAPALYTGIDVGFSSLCVHDPLTYRFLDDVIRELAALTPGPYLSIGGDEAHSTSPADYVRFVDRVQAIVHKYGKTLWGWHETASADVAAGSVAVYWGTGGAVDIALAQQAVKKGEKLVLAPANHAYLDMQYNPDSPYGLHWAGYVSVQESYNWDPATLVPGVGEQDVFGVEAPIWSETLPDITAVEFMAFPRLAGIAEIGWSPAATHSWADYRVRLAAQGPRWTLAGINYYHAPDVPWSLFAPFSADKASHPAA